MHGLYAAVRPVGAISLSTGCFTESRWAALTKPATASLDLGLVVGQRAPNSRDELVDLCARGGGRRAPLLPHEFVTALEAKSFTNGKADRPLVAGLYEAAFHNAFRHAFVLKYDQLGWSDEEVEAVARVLTAVAEQGSATLKGKHSLRAAQLNELYLMDNNLGDRGAIALLTAASKLRGLSWINLSDNEAVGDATLDHLTTLLAASKSNFKRLRELRFMGIGAGERAKTALASCCKGRKIQLKFEREE